MKAQVMITVSAVFLAIASSCEITPVDNTHDTQIPIRISSSVTKVSGDQFDDNDAVGIYVVNANEAADGGWTSGTLVQSGNHLDNVKYFLSGTTWSSDKEYYWKDSKTQAEFYCYYPYKETVDDIEKLCFEIPNDQSSVQAYISAEILWGKTNLTAPTEEYVRISTTHRMSQIAISVVPGKGYTEESLKDALKSIKINALKCGAQLNLKDGSLTATGDEKDIVPFDDNGTYRAMIVPQTVTNRVLVTLDINGMERTLTTSIEFSSNSRKKCTLTINKISEGVNVGIGAWEDDDTDYGGVLN